MKTNALVDFTLLRQAVSMRITGIPYARIFAELGIEHGQEAYKNAIRESIKQEGTLITANVENYMVTQLLRCEAMLPAHLELGTLGDDKRAIVALKIMERMDKIIDRLAKYQIEKAETALMDDSRIFNTASESDLEMMQHARQEIDSTEWSPEDDGTWIEPDMSGVPDDAKDAFTTIMHDLELTRGKDIQ